MFNYQRQFACTLRTLRATLILCVQYLAEVGVADELLAEVQAWALVCLAEEELDALAEYAASRQGSLHIIYGTTFRYPCWPPGKECRGGWRKASPSGSCAGATAWSRPTAGFRPSLVVMAGVIPAEEHTLVRGGAELRLHRWQPD